MKYLRSLPEYITATLILLGISQGEWVLFIIGLVILVLRYLIPMVWRWIAARTNIPKT